MKIVLDAHTCTGHGRCYSLAPELFEPDDLGHCSIRDPEPPAGLQAAARRAVASCPEEALSLEE